MEDTEARGGMGWLFGTRRRLMAATAAATALSVGAGVALTSWIRAASTDVGLNFVFIVLWVASMMGASALQAILAGDLLWGGRWRRRALLGWQPATDDIEPDDVKDRSWVMYLLMVGLLAVNYGANGALNGGFFGWYQFRGFDLVRLRAEDPAQRLEAVLELAGHDDPAVWAELVPRVQDSDPAVRAEAVGVMGDLGIQAARAGVFEALEGASPGVRAAAAEALGKLGGAGVVEALTGMLSRDRDPDVRRGALAGLGLLGAPEAGEAVAWAAGPGEESDAVRATAAWAVGRLRPAAAAGVLEAALGEGAGPATRCAAAHAIAVLAGGPDGGQAVRTPEALRAAFARGHGALGEPCDRLFVTSRAHDRCFVKLNAPSDVPYEGPCLDLQIASPEPLRIKLLRAAVRAAGKASMAWLAEVNNDEAEPPEVRSWAADLFLRLKGS